MSGVECPQLPARAKGDKSVLFTPSNTVLEFMASVMGGGGENV